MIEGKLYKQQEVIGIFKDGQLEDFYGNKYDVLEELSELSKEDYLKFAKKRYKRNSYFYTATKNISVPLKVTSLNLAQHEERTSEISLIEHAILRKWLEISPKSAKINKNHRHYPYFEAQTKQLQKRLKDLKLFGVDIVEEEGGVIYCGTLNQWAECYTEAKQKKN